MQIMHYNDEVVKSQKKKKVGKNKVKSKKSPGVDQEY